MNKKEQELPLAAFVKVAEILLRKTKQLESHKVRAIMRINVLREAKIVFKVDKRSVPCSSAV